MYSRNIFTSKVRIMAKLCVNIDHVATIRQARRGIDPDPVAAAVLAELGGAASITCHLREDRRHMQDDDVRRLLTVVRGGLNLEMACTEELLAIAASLPQLRMVMFVPERRLEITTEGGLDVAGKFDSVAAGVKRMVAAGHRVSLFIDARETQIDAALAAGAQVVELHTGPYANASGDDVEKQLDILVKCAAYAQSKGLMVNAGHGLTLRNVTPVAAIKGLNELHIGHSIISHAVMVGLERAVREMCAAIERGRELAESGLAPLDILRRY